MAALWTQFWSEEDGVTAVEYALIAGLLFLVIVGGVKALGTRSAAMYTNIRVAIEAAE